MIRWLFLLLVFAAPAMAQQATLRPVARPEQTLIAPAPIEAAAPSESAVATSLRPKLRPAAVAQAAEAARIARVKGQICGDPDLQGDVLGTVAGRGACGVENAVRVKSVAGIRFPANPTMNCETAVALKTWVQRGVAPQIGSEGGGIQSIRTVSDFSCRNRNNQAGEKLSEHGKGRAIDIAGIKLNSGREISVLRDWGNGEDGKRLRGMWQAACGPFGTVLGPEANRFHRDHFHFDTARSRSGPYCR